MLTKDDLMHLLKFTEFTNLFANVYRKTITNKDDSIENNAQHSFQLAIVGWYMCQKAKLNLDVEKIIKYSLVHDLVEVYSGNYPAYSRTKDNQTSKELTEKEALNKIKQQFADFPELYSAIRDFSEMSDDESKFVYALDKLIPILNIELNNNDFYFRSQTTFEDMKKLKSKKIATDPTVNEYFDLLQNYLTEDVKFFWPNCKDRDYSRKNYFNFND